MTLITLFWCVTRVLIISILTLYDHLSTLVTSFERVVELVDTPDCHSGEHLCSCGFDPRLVGCHFSLGQRTRRG